MKRKILKRNNKIILFNLILFILLYFSNIDFSDIKIFQDDFLITFMISVIGIFLAIITLLYGLMDKIVKLFSDLSLTDSINKIYTSLDELKDNTILIFYSVLFIFLINFVSKINICSINFDNYFNTKLFLYDLRLTILSLVLFAINDTIKTFFIILNISRFPSKKKGC